MAGRHGHRNINRRKWRGVGRGDGGWGAGGRGDHVQSTFVIFSVVRKVCRHQTVNDVYVNISNKGHLLREERGLRERGVRGGAGGECKRGRYHAESLRAISTKGDESANDDVHVLQSTALHHHLNTMDKAHLGAFENKT